MCDYDDGGWRHISSKQVKTRKPRYCASCGGFYSGGSLMLRSVGIWEGDLTTGYSCETCQFASAQRDETPLHICSGDMMSASQWSDQYWTHCYIKAHLQKQLKPTEVGLTAYLRLLFDADEADLPREDVSIPLNESLP